MPYGVAKKSGGDSAANVKRMEDCVAAILKEGKVDKVSAIRICKSRLFPRGTPSRG